MSTKTHLSENNSSSQNRIFPGGNFRRKSRKKIVCAYLVLILCLSPVVPLISYATTQDALDETNRKLDELRAEQSGISYDIAELVSQIDGINETLNSLEVQIQDKQSQIDSLTDEKSMLEEEKKRQYDAMKLRIKYMYEHGSQNALDMMLGAESLADFLSKSEYIAQLSSYDRKMLDNMEDIITRLAQTSDELNADIAELDTLKIQASEEAENLKQLLLSKQQQLDTNSGDIARFEELALQYEQQLEEERIRESEKTSQNNAGSGGSIINAPIDYNATDLEMLAAIIECESGNQPYEGKCAVGSVVINRVRNSRFANTISEVLFAPGQFSPVASGRFAVVLARGAKDDCVQAAQDVLNGYINVNALYFHAYRGSIDDDKLRIGDHVFF